jgi:hypothetical protein
MICYDLSAEIITIIIICVPVFLSASGGFTIISKLSPQ